MVHKLTYLLTGKQDTARVHFERSLLANDVYVPSLIHLGNALTALVCNNIDYTNIN